MCSSLTAAKRAALQNNGNQSAGSLQCSKEVMEMLDDDMERTAVVPSSAERHTIDDNHVWLNRVWKKWKGLTLDFNCFFDLDILTDGFENDRNVDGGKN